MADMKLQLLLQAKDSLTNVVKSACTQSDDAFKKMNDTLKETAGKFSEIGGAAVKAGGVLMAISAVNAKVAGDFEAGMNNVSTLIDTNNENLKSMSNEVLSLSANSAKPISDLTDGLYSIRSAGISANDQFKVLSGSEKLATAGLSSTAEAVDVATSAINAFGLEGEKQTKIYDMFFKVVKYGKTNISEFAQGFGSVAPIVASAGIELDEYSASIAAMTTAGVKASIAHTQLKAAIAGLSRGSKDQLQVFSKYGVKSFDELVKKSGGMVNAFNKIVKATNGNKSQLISLVGSVEAYNAILSLTGSTNKVYLQALEDMRNGGDSLSEAYEKQADGLNYQMGMLKNNLQMVSIQFGTALLPLVKAAGGALKTVSGIISKMPEGMTSFITIAGGMGGAILLTAGSALIAVGSMVKNLVYLREMLRGASIAAWGLNISLKAALGWGAVILAVGAAAVYAYNHFEGFRNVCQGLWETIKAGGAWLGVFGKIIANCAVTIWNCISPLVKFGATVLSWTTPLGLVIRAITTLVKTMGGLRGIGDKLKEWAGNSKEAADNVNEKLPKPKPDGSHAAGLNYVPYDGYIAETHKGEAILSADEADIWRNIQQGNIYNRNSNISADNSSINLTYSPNVTLQGNSTGAKDDFIKLLQTHKEEILRLILELLRRREARAY